MYLRLILITILVVISTSVMAQDTEKGTETYRLVMKDGNSFHVYNGRLTATAVEGVTRQDSSVVVSREDIYSLYRYGGTKADKGAKKGALIGLGFSAMVYVMAIAETSNDRYTTVDHGKALGMTVVITMVTTGIGALIGSASKDWERIPLESGFQFDPADRSVGVSFSLRF